MTGSTVTSTSLYKRITTYAIAITVSVLATPGKSPAQTVDESAVRAVVEGMIAADNVKNLNRVLGFYSDDAILISPEGGDVVGISAIRSHYERLFARTDLDIQLKIQDILLDGDLAVVRGVNDVTATSDDGSSSARSKFLISLRRYPDGAWRVLHLMWSNQPTSPE